MTQRLLCRPADGEPLAVRPLEQLDDVRESGQLIWVDATTSDPDEIEALGARFGFDSDSVEDILDVEQYPKFEDYQDHVFVVIHGLSSEGDRVDTREVDCFIGENLFVTVHAEPIVGIDWLWDAVQRHAHLAGHSSDELFGQLAEVIGRRYFEIANALEARIDDLAEDALEANASVLAEVQILRREEATVRQMLRPQLLVIGDLRIRNRTVIGESAARLLGDAYDVHRQVVESLASTRGLLNDTLDTYRGASADNQARATTLLAVYSAVLLPLSLITGWYGMNVASLPAAERQHAWWIVTLVMLAIAIVSIVIFIRIGLIRINRDRTTRLTSGLAGAAKVPVKPFTMLRKPVASGGHLVADAIKATGRPVRKAPSARKPPAAGESRSTRGD